MRIGRFRGLPAAWPTPPLTTLLLLGGMSVPAAELGAQIRIGLHLGPIASTRFLRDSIVEPVSVRPNPGLAVSLSADKAVQGGYRVGLRFTATRSNVETHDQSQGSTPITTLTVLHPAAYLRQMVNPWLVAEARLGLFLYAPSEREATFFREGAPPRPSLGLGLGIQRRLGQAVALEALATYDVHRFSTPALRAAGFTGETVVHRFGLQVGLQRVLSDGPSR